MTVTERLFGAKSDDVAAAADDAPPRPEVLNPRMHPLAKGRKQELNRAEIRVQDLRDRRRDLREQKRQLEATSESSEGAELTNALHKLDDVERDLGENRRELSEAATARDEAADAYERALHDAKGEIESALRAYLLRVLPRLDAACAEVQEICEEVAPMTEHPYNARIFEQLKGDAGRMELIPRVPRVGSASTPKLTVLREQIRDALQSLHTD